MNHIHDIPGGRLARIGGAWGLICALALAILRTVLGFSSGDPFPFGLPGDLVFGAIYALPFALALVALHWGGPAGRAGAWAAASILAVLAFFTSFSLVGLVFAPAALLLMIAAGRAAWGRPIGRVALAVGLAALLVVLNAGAFRALYLQQDGACWHLIREANGFERWEAAPYGSTGAIDASGFGVVEARCSSDVYSAQELLFSSGLLALAAGAWFAARAIDGPVRLPGS
jgi:hypothetical protein